MGHDPERVISLCVKHHHERHDELLKILFQDGLAIFALADGTFLGEAILRALPRKGGRARPGRVVVTTAAGGVAVVPAGERVAVAPAQLAIVSDARKALVALGFGVREADSLIAAAGVCATTDQLVLEALRRKPESP